MTGITQKSCVALFTLWYLKKTFFVKCESTETHKKLQVEI